MRKGITPIIAIIVLLLITVALAGAAWSYLSLYWQGLTSKSIEVTSTMCVGSGTAVVFMRNTGTQSITTSEIAVIDADSGNQVTVNWYDPTGGTLTDNIIGTGKVAKFEATCGVGNLCSYQIITTARGRALQTIIQC